MKKKQREIKVLEIIIQYIPLTGKENNKSLENRPVQSITTTAEYTKT